MGIFSRIFRAVYGFWWWLRDYDSCYFGWCPKCRCGKHTTYCNLRKNIWFFCEKHKVCWWGGYGLFSSWHDETPEDWDRNAVMLQQMQVVEPWYPLAFGDCGASETAAVAIATDDEIPF